MGLARRQDEVRGEATGLFVLVCGDLDRGGAVAVRALADDRADVHVGPSVAQLVDLLVHLAHERLGLGEAALVGL